MQTLGLDGPDHRGHAGLREALEKFIEVWDYFEFEPTYILDLGDRVLSLLVSITPVRAGAASSSTWSSPNWQRRQTG
jgi:hypothetical protein